MAPCDKCNSVTSCNCFKEKKRKYHEEFKIKKIEVDIIKEEAFKELYQYLDEHNFLFDNIDCTDNDDLISAFYSFKRELHVKFEDSEKK